MNLPTVIVLASGRGERFKASGGQGSKLDALIEGRRVLDWVIAAAHDADLPVHVEDAGHPGMGDSIAAAVRATSHAAGWLILPGDLPLILAQTIRNVADALIQGAQAAYPVYFTQNQKKRGHPVGFSQNCLEKLQNLKGNQGAAPVLHAQAATEIIVNDEGCLLDVDTLELLEEARKRVSLVNFLQKENIKKISIKSAGL